MSLNPCCSGQWSRTERRFPYLCRGPVLILVVVDNGLVQRCTSMFKLCKCSLNPCCSGQWSSTKLSNFDKLVELCVLILVVVDNGLVHSAKYQWVQLPLS